MTTISLSNLPKRPGRRSRRVGRGHGSGRGTYSGRGIKGQRARTGGRRGIIRRAMTRMMSKLPKQRGFRSDWPKYVVVTLAALEKSYDPGTVITAATVAARGARLSGSRGVKILGTGTVTKPFTVRVQAYSVSAKKAILAAGGSAEVVALKV